MNILNYLKVSLNRLFFKATLKRPRDFMSQIAAMEDLAQLTERCGQ